MILTSSAARAAGDPAQNRRNEGTTPKRLVLVTIDTVRADHVGAYGYFRPTTPFFDKLAAAGVVFERAFAHSSSTGPSHASMFTSLYPLQHGMRRNGFSVAPGVRTLAETLRDSGYVTAAFVSASVLGSGTKINRGFERYVDAIPSRPRVHYQLAESTTDRVIDWLSKRKNAAVAKRAKPLFLWVHYFDAHTPWQPDADVLKAVAPTTDAEARAFQKRLVTEHRSHLKSPAADAKNVSRYDGEIRYVDGQIERLYQYLSEDDPGSLWLVTSDHGEGVYNHGFSGHVTEIYNEQIQVPFVMHWTGGGGPSGVRVREAFARHVDIVPTVLEALDIDGLSDFARIEGRSLLPFISTPNQSDDAVVFAQVGGERNQCADKFAFSDGRQKIITTFTDPRAEMLFDIRADSYETRNLVRQDVQATNALRGQLAGFLHGLVESSPGYDSKQKEPDSEMLRNLRALGYLN